MKITALLNMNSGSLRNLDEADLVDRMRTAFAKRGHELKIDTFRKGDLLQKIETAASSDSDCILIAGGDGSVSCAAAIAWRTGKTLAILPCGTMNLYARTLGIPLEIDKAIEAVSAGTVRKVDIATANERAFLHQVSFGFQARAIRLRDQLEFKSRIGKMMSSMRSIVSVAADPPNFPVSITVDGETLTRQVSAISVSNNPYGEDHLPYANSADEGLFGLYWTRPISLPAALKVLLDVMRGKWKENDKIGSARTTAVRITFPAYKKQALAIIDGEKVPLEPEYTFTMHGRKLSVLAPAINQDGSGEIG